MNNILKIIKFVQKSYPKHPNSTKINSFEMKQNRQSGIKKTHTCNVGGGGDQCERPLSGPMRRPGLDTQLFGGSLQYSCVISKLGFYKNRNTKDEK